MVVSESKSPYDLDNALGFWLHITFNKLRAESERRMAKYGVTPEQWALLVRLWQKDDRTQTELAGSTFRDKPSVTRMLDGLERAGYIVRARHLEDGRSHRILLTEAGRALQHHLVPLVVGITQEVGQGIPRRDLETTLSTLKAMYQNLG